MLLNFEFSLGKKEDGTTFWGWLVPRRRQVPKSRKANLVCLLTNPIPSKTCSNEDLLFPGARMLMKRGRKTFSLSLYFLFFLWKFDLFCFVCRERDPRSSVDFRASKKRVGCYVIIFDGKKNSFPRPGREVGWKVFSLLKYNWIRNFNRT